MVPKWLCASAALAVVCGPEASGPVLPPVAFAGSQTPVPDVAGLAAWVEGVLASADALAFEAQIDHEGELFEARAAMTPGAFELRVSRAWGPVVKMSLSGGVVREVTPRGSVEYPSPAVEGPGDCRSLPAEVACVFGTLTVTWVGAGATQGARFAAQILRSDAVVVEEIDGRRCYGALRHEPGPDGTPLLVNGLWIDAELGVPRLWRSTQVQEDGAVIRRERRYHEITIGHGPGRASAPAALGSAHADVLLRETRR